MRLSRLAYLASLGGYAALAATLIAWYGWLAPEDLLGRVLLILLLIPLAFPLWGLARGRAYTHAWASMLALFYMALALTETLSAPLERAYAYSALFASLLFFLGCVCYVRLLARERQGRSGAAELGRAQR